MWAVRSVEYTSQSNNRIKGCGRQIKESLSKKEINENIIEFVVPKIDHSERTLDVEKC